MSIEMSTPVEDGLAVEGTTDGRPNRERDRHLDGGAGWVGRVLGRSVAGALTRFPLGTMKRLLPTRRQPRETPVRVAAKGGPPPPPPPRRRPMAAAATAVTTSSESLTGPVAETLFDAVGSPVTRKPPRILPPDFPPRVRSIPR
jgi:hypothetical protein